MKIVQRNKTLVLGFRDKNYYSKNYFGHNMINLKINFWENKSGMVKDSNTLVDKTPCHWPMS